VRSSEFTVGGSALIQLFDG